jgi:tetratricopeptide (TPR) repeat protein
MITTKKRRRLLFDFAAIAVAGTLLTACGPPGARQLRLGEQLIREGQYPGAIAVLKEAVLSVDHATQPAQSKAWNLLGLAEQDGGHLDEASEAYLRARKLDRDNAVVDYNLGCLRMEQTNFQGAIDYFSTYTSLRLKDARGYVRLGAARYHLALEQRTTSERNRQIEAARQQFEAAERWDATAEAPNFLGVIELQRRPPTIQSATAAAENFKLALRRDPHFAPALLNLGIVWQQYLNQPRQALKAYQEYLAGNPPLSNVKAVQQLATDLNIRLRTTITTEHAPAPAPAPPPAKSIITPTNAQAPSPKPLPTESPPAHAAAPVFVPATVPTPVPPPAPTASEPSRPSTPISPPPLETSPPVNTADINPQPAAEPSAPPPRQTLVQKLNPLRWFSGKPKTAEEAAAAEAEPPSVPPGSRFDYPPPVTLIPGDRAEGRRLTADGARARDAGDFNQALRAYTSAVAADPTYYDANLGLGLTEIDVRAYAGALEALHRALTVQADSAEARYAFAWTLQKRGYAVDAVHELSKLLEQHPADVRSHLLLGNLYAEKLRETKLAREQYSQALALDPKNPEAPSVRAWLQQNQ